MANRYIIHGAANCGDGTASNEAASAGAVGAWNHINILTGTAPTNTTNIPAAGDTIYIRSKSSAGADITITMVGATYYGSTTATSTNRVSWVLDNGTIWAGIDGKLVSESSAAAHQALLRNYNDFYSSTAGSWEHRKTGTGLDNVIIGFEDNTLSGIKTSTPNATSGGSTHLYGINNNFSRLRTYDCIHEGRADRFIDTRSGTKITLVNPRFISTAGNLIKPSDRHVLTILGGSWTGPGATTGAYVLDTVGNRQYGQINLIGFNYPKTVLLSADNPSIDWPVYPNAVGADGVLGGEQMSTWGRISSRTDSNPPTLNATLPDSLATPWSWFVYPQFASKTDPAHLLLSVYYTSAPATKTITLELLLADTFTGIDASSIYMVGSYVDATTGESIGFNTYNHTGGALTVSTAAWSATTYGAVSLLKRSLSITTPSTIKQNTLVNIAFFMSKASASANDIVFICPSVQLS